MTAVADGCAELAPLLSRFPAALPKDNTGLRSHAITAGIPVNTDVLNAADTLHRDIPATTQHACQTVAEPWQPRTLTACLTALPRLAWRMHNLNLAAAEDDLETALRRWVRLAKLALGLRTPDIPLGHVCYLHDDPVELVAAGNEGFVRPSRDGLTVEWVYAERVFCPGCGTSWGRPEWLWLRRRVLQETR